MRSRHVRVAAIFSAVAVVMAGILWVWHLQSASVRANRLNVESVARRFPNFTRQQRLAIIRELQSQIHPAGRDMSPAELLKKLAGIAIASDAAPPAPANFVGNLTVVNTPDADLMALPQQSDCSLTLRYGPYNLISGPMFSYTVANSTPSYGNVLHGASGLTTTGGHFPTGCGDSQTGVTSRKIVFAGVTTGAVRVYAGHFYYVPSSEEQIDVVTARSDDTFQNFTSLTNTNTSVDLLTADLNGDGNGDLVSINTPASTGSATVTIFLGKADGSFPAPTEIDLAGNTAISGVIDDFNGDGKKDLLIATSTGITSPSTIYYLNFLAGNGDGTFQAVKSYTVTPLANLASTPYFGLVSEDLRGSGHKDLVTSAGIILFGNGDGTFTQSPTAAFPSSIGTSSYGPNVVAGDFNKDGKPDLAMDDGDSIHVYLGKGDGTFTPGAAYATVGNVGYLVAQDIDGDGNLDLYSGTGNNGTLGGDQFNTNLGYAIMGNGDGTFRGAPWQPFAYTGTNLGDLNKDGAVDAVGVNSDESFTSYLGDGKGNFKAGAALATSPITLNGTKYTLNGIDSYSVADLNDDGFADLVYLGTQFYGPGYAPGVFVALGKGDGSFAAPVFVAAPPFVAAPDIDVNPTITGIRVADINHDGKADLVYLYNTVSYNNHNSYVGIAVQPGNGDGTFKNTSQLTQLFSGATAPNPGAYQLALIGDLNHDNVPDFLVLSGLSANANSFTLQTLLGKGDGTFKAPVTVNGVTPAGILFGTQSAPVALADMNNDGIVDLVALEDDSVTQNLDIAIALGNGDGTFKSPGITNYSQQYVVGAGLAVADFDGDGNLDVATTGFIGTQGDGIAFGNGDGTLKTGGDSSSVTPVQGLYLGTTGADVALDLNGDGKSDILAGSVEFLSQAGGHGTGPAASTTSLLVSASSVDVGQKVTFSALVTGPSGDSTVPTGSVSFNNGATVLGTGTLDATGAAAFSTTSLVAGNYSITAAYGGDSNFSPSTSSAVPLTVVTPPPPDFTISLAQSSATFTFGTAGTISDGINVTSVNGFNQPVALSCSGAPQFATCSVTPASVTPNGSTPGASTLNIATDVSTTAGISSPTLRNSRGLAALAFLGGGWIFIIAVPRIRSHALHLGLLLCLVGGPLLGCGGSSSNKTSNNTPKGTYTITVTATAGTTTHSTPFTLTIQ